MTADEIFTHCVVEHADGNICFSCAKEAVAQEREECAVLSENYFGVKNWAGAQAIRGRGKGCEK